MGGRGVFSPIIHFHYYFLFFHFTCSPKSGMTLHVNSPLFQVNLSKMFTQEKFKLKSKRDTFVKQNIESKALKTAWSYLPYWNSSVKQEVDHVISKVWCLHLSYFSIIDKLKGKHVSYHFYKILIHLSDTISLHEGLCFQKLQVCEKFVLLYFSFCVTHTWYWTAIKSRTRR